MRAAELLSLEGEDEEDGVKVGVVEQNSSSVTLFLVHEGVEVLGWLARRKQEIDMRGTGLVVAVGGEMVASGSFDCPSCCFTHVLSLLLKHLMTSYSSVAMAFLIDSSPLSTLKSKTSLKYTSLKSILHFKTIVLRATTSAHNYKHSQ